MARKNRESRRPAGDESLDNESSMRLDRETEERELTEDRELDDDERVEMLSGIAGQVALPDLPEREGWHRCWLTTNNPRDTIHARMRLGYKLIKASSIPGFEPVAITTGDYSGFIGVNEMLAAEIPTDLYLKFMKAVHHDQPMEEERRLEAITEQLREEAAKRRLRIQAEPGTAELGKKQKRPIFETGA